MKRVYITHCSAKKDESLRGAGSKVPPDRLYTATPLRRFVQRSKDARVDWAIFSDKCGVVFPHERIEWYDKHPSKVGEEEFALLLENFIRRLSGYDEIWFYHNPGRFHRLYERLVQEARARGLRVMLFSHLCQIE